MYAQRYSQDKQRGPLGFHSPSESQQYNMEPQRRDPSAIAIPSANTLGVTARVSNPPTSASTSMSFRYYQPPKSKRVDTESEDESSEEDRRLTSRKSASTASQVSKRGACTHCKGLKVKCHFGNGQGSCQRCILNKLQCVVIGRKKRRAVATHEELLMKSHKQDLDIANLLHQFDELTTEYRIRSWLEKAPNKSGNSMNSPVSQHSMPSSGSSSMGRGHTSWTSSYGFGELESPCSPSMKMSANYFPSPSNHFSASPVERYTVHDLLPYFPDESVTVYTKPPEIVARGIIHPADVQDLFIIYFKLINPYFSILDPVLHTPERLFWRSHFLFTLICCIATKYSPKYSPMVPVFVEFARDMAGKALVEGRKTIDECQAFLIQSVYQLPRKHFEEQRGWLFMGLAFSLAEELKLNEPPRGADFEEMDSKEMMGWGRELALRKRMNRIRTWLNCYCVDASHATQFGKPAMLDVEDYIARTCKEWYTFPYSLSIDVHLVAYVDVSRVVRHFRIDVEQLEADEREERRQDPTSQPKIPEVLKIVHKYHDQLLDLHAEWSNRFRNHPNHDDYMCGYRADMNRMINAFNRLVVLFYGLQRVVSANKSAKGAGASRDDNLVRQCIETAKEVIKGMIYKLHPTGMLRYSMEAHFLFVTFAAAHLLSLLRPEMSILLRPSDVEDIDRLVRGLVKVLRSKEVSEDNHGRHAPYHYARYLTKQLKTFSALLPQNKHQDGAVTSPHQSNEHYSFAHRTDAVTIANPSAWTGPVSETVYHDIGSSVDNGLGSHAFQPELRGANRSYADGQALELSGYPVDFSLINFMQTVNNPQFTKDTPPPGDTEDTSQWWQQMYPVNNQTTWPMTIEGHASLLGSGQKLSPNR